MEEIGGIERIWEGFRGRKKGPGRNNKENKDDEKGSLDLERRKKIQVDNMGNRSKAELSDKRENGRF